MNAFQILRPSYVALLDKVSREGGCLDSKLNDKEQRAARALLKKGLLEWSKQWGWNLRANGARCLSIYAEVAQAKNLRCVADAAWKHYGKLFYVPRHVWGSDHEVSAS